MFSMIDWFVLLAGIGLIATINWYFFLAGKRAVAATSTNGVQEIAITVRGGYSPGVVRAKRGQPVRLVFDRQETSGCSEEIVLPEFGIRKFLPPYKKTTIQLEPRESGSYEFTCGMGMLRGTLVVE